MTAPRKRPPGASTHRTAAHLIAPPHALYRMAARAASHVRTALRHGIRIKSVHPLTLAKLRRGKPVTRGTARKMIDTAALARARLAELPLAKVIPFVRPARPRPPFRPRPTNGGHPMPVPMGVAA